MTKQDKQLLLRDLCARLPYNVCVHIRYKEGEPCYGKLTPKDIQWFIDSNIEVIKPYLRPLSSMTEEEREEFRVGGVMSHNIQNDSWAISAFTPEAYDWLNAHYFDYRGLIPKGLAIEVTKENNPYKN